MEHSEHCARLQFFTSSGGRIAYRDEGNGDVIVLVHGVPTSSWVYSDIIEILVLSGYRVIAPDMLGFGYSDNPVGYDIYSAANQGKRLNELVHHLGLTSWTHVFHDGGGLWSWEMIRQGARGIKKLVSLNSIFYQEGFHPPMKFSPGWIATQFVRLYTFSLGQVLVLNGTFKNGLSKNVSLTPDKLTGYKAPLRAKGGDRGLYYFFTQTCHKIQDFTALHKSIEAPLCVIWGRTDSMLRWKDIADKVSANFNLKKEDVHIIEANHFIQEEQPVFIAETIAEFASRG
jgi:haloalkane dehalogenase